ncbi:NAD(P)-dependent alcohol dehydrogenase [Streptacidiphilus melanogenes]|uniref:NAD(P)-dependent alcohol dehydrogenase n=1 Tax=Streptacidiphilus melanogenes TaxID=411235 RepID=UPI0005A9C7D5|nr:NAD(P)-dependent alcohol dehydrogenase [Streptacidiphilus melanogenes]
MRAVVHDVYGPPQVLRLAQVDRPDPGPGEVLVAVRASAVDQGLWHVTAGLPYLIRATPFRLRRGRARVRGMDVAGVVQAVGQGVTDLRPGDEVYGTCDGAFAEYACAEPRRLAPKPTGVGFGEAAVVPVSGCTALQALRDAGRLRPGQSVLVLGAGGGVGTFAVQLAKALGAGHVTGVCGSRHLELVGALGADEVVDYTRPDARLHGRRYDLVLDIAGGRPLSELRRLLNPRGTVVFVGGETGGRWFGGLDRQLRGLLLGLVTSQRFRPLVGTQRHDDLRQLARFVDSGAVRPVVDRRYPLAELSAALTHLREGHPGGKIAIDVAL